MAMLRKFIKCSVPGGFKTLTASYSTLAGVQGMLFTFDPKIGANCAVTVAIIDAFGKTVEEYSSADNNSRVRIDGGRVFFRGEPGRFKITIVCN